MSRLAVLLPLLLPLLLAVASAKKFTRCGLAKELRSQGFPASELSNWVCLVESESGRDTSRVGGPNKNGSYDYGLYQINSKYWCGRGKIGGDCHLKCEDLIDDNVTNDSTCAKKIFKRHGFNAWYGWRNKCKGKPLPDVSKC